MAQLAIRGHVTRGKEVIEILEMLGGVNECDYVCDLTDSVYSIDRTGTIDWCVPYPDSPFVIFTLEEFLEKFPYKIGDKVIYEDKRREITKMVWEERTNTVAYKLDDKLYCNVINDLQPYKEETMEDKLIPRIDLAGYCKDKYIIDLGNYEIKKENGKTYAVRKQSKEPKTYEECCRVVNANPRIRLVYDLSDGQKYSYDADNLRLYESIRKLIICRDAYWKIAGEQMGLGKSWEPDWNKSDQFKNVLICRSNNIIKYAYAALNTILAFPTEEMRDAFYENFKDLIEECKEFL